MKISIMSDLHINHMHNPIDYPSNDEGSDVLVLAGDIMQFSQLFKDPNGDYYEFFEYVAYHYTTVIYVPGNHEYYGGTLSKEYLADAVTYLEELSNVYLVDNAVVTVDWINFICTTMWSHVSKDASMAIEYSISDYSVIANSQGRTLKVIDTNAAHSDAINFIKNTLLVLESAVVVTHHLPSFESVAPQYTGSNINGAFASEYGDFILTNTDKIPVWIHGHTHTPCDYTIGNTRVVCNPKGYRSEQGVRPYTLKQITI